MLPPTLRVLRRALSQTHAGAILATLASEHRAAELLERTQRAAVDAAAARLTPAEFRKWYGYAPGDAPRMRTCAELLAYR